MRSRCFTKSETPRMRPQPSDSALFRPGETPINNLQRPSCDLLERGAVS